METTKKGRAVHAVPQGFHTVTPYLVVDNAAGLIEFIKKAFNGKQTFRTDQGDKIMHATVTIGDSTIMISDTMEGTGTHTAMLYLYMENVDAVYERALKAKGTSVREPRDEFYGDRAAAVTDQWGNTWWIATHIEDVDENELERRSKEARTETGHEMHA